MLSKRARVNTVRTHVSIGHMYTCRVQSVHCSVSCIQYLCWAKSLSRLTMCCRNCCFVWRTARRRNHKTLISSILITAVLRRCRSRRTTKTKTNKQRVRVTAASPIVPFCACFNFHIMRVRANYTANK